MRTPSNVKTWIARFATVTTHHLVFPTMSKHTLLQVLREVIGDDKFAFDQALRASVGPYVMSEPFV